MAFALNPIKSYKKEELSALCERLREIIFQTVSKSGGHLASNLGAVESTVALCYAFDFPNDKIVFDVGHQCYTYKLLTGRANEFATLRKRGGISGFPKRTESEYDCYGTGHAGTSVSAALGLAKARDILGGNETVIAYIGDGSFQNGLVYEALNSLSSLNTKILIILNDNGMSISPTVGGMHDILTDIRRSDAQNQVRLLESFGLTYLGVKDGNDVFEMLNALEEAKTLLKNNSVLLHISTTKGKGYAFSEEDPVDTHGVTPSVSVEEKEYSQILGKTLCNLAENNDKIAVICAAMKEPLGLSKFFEKYGERAFDVGICEENAAVLCASMAAGGLKPYYAVYSTFLQRAFDEIIHDVCAQDLPVTFCVDRAGISGTDGETHQGVFDLSYLSLIPNLTVAVPKDTLEFEKMLEFSVNYPHPLVIRYPRSGKSVFNVEGKPLKAGEWEFLHRAKGSKIAVLATGERTVTMAMQALKKAQKNGKEFDIVNARFVKPLDEAFFKKLSYENLVTLEDNVFLGGFGASVQNALIRLEKDCKVKSFAYPDTFIPHGNAAELQREFGVSEEALTAYLTEIL